MVDWLIVWGVAQAAGLVFKPILEDLAKESAKDYAKDFFKDCLKKVVRLPEPDLQKEAYGKALKELLKLIQEELENAGYQDAQIQQFTQPLKQWIQQPDVATELGRAFEADCRAIATSQLAKTWKDLNLPYLPDDFDWYLIGKLYVRAVKKIIQDSDTLRPIFSAQAQDATAAGVQELVGIAPDFNLRQYAEGLREEYGALKLDPLDTTGVYYSELKLWKMFIPQSVRECQEFSPQVYELPKEHVRRLRESGQLDETEIAEAELERYRKVYVDQPIRPVLEIVGDPTSSSPATNSRLPLRYDGTMRYDGAANYGDSPVRYAVILGDPGSGKSSLLQYIALVWAERPVSELPLHPIPLLIELRTYARDKQEKKCKDILSFIHSGNVTCRLNQQQLHAQLQQGEVIALFDGIDEVFNPALRDEVVKDIHRFTNTYPNVQVIATSRWLGYKAQRLRNAEFRHFMLQELDEGQIEAFIQRWHDLTFPEGADKTRKRDRLQKAIQDSKAIRELAGNPLLLTMMAILNRHQELPRDRPRLYERASEVLLHQWDVERNLIEHRLDPMAIDYRDKQAMLRKVAYHMQSNEKGLAGNIISATDLEKILTDHLKKMEIDQATTVARFLKNQLRTRNFILCDLGGETYAFVHRTFLEFFCAWSFVWEFKETQTLSFEQLRDEVFARHYQDEAWHEVLLLIFSMLNTQFQEKILEFLGISHTIFCEGLYKHLLENTNHFLKPEIYLFLRFEIIDLIFEIIKEQFSIIVQMDRYDGANEDFSNLFLAADCFAEIKNRSHFKIHESIIRERCKDLAQWEDYYDADAYKICKRAISTVAKIWTHERETLLWLKDIFESKDSNINDPFVREQAVWEISTRWRSEPETLSFLKKLANSYEEPPVTYAAISGIAQGWNKDLEVLNFLIKVSKSEDDHASSHAMYVLARYWRDEPKVLRLLKELARESNYENNSHYRSNCTAIEMLAKNWGDELESLIIIIDLILEDISALSHDYEIGIHLPHALSVAGIFKGLSRNSSVDKTITELLLKNRMDVAALWNILIKELGKICSDQPKLLKSFYDVAAKCIVTSSDANFNSQKLAVQVLRDRAINDPDEQLREWAQQQLAQLEQ